MMFKWQPVCFLKTFCKVFSRETVEWSKVQVDCHSVKESFQSLYLSLKINKVLWNKVHIAALLFCRDEIFSIPSENKPMLMSCACCTNVNKNALEQPILGDFYISVFCANKTYNFRSFQYLNCFWHLLLINEVTMSYSYPRFSHTKLQLSNKVQLVCSSEVCDFFRLAFIGLILFKVRPTWSLYRCDVLDDRTVTIGPARCWNPAALAIVLSRTNSGKEHKILKEDFSQWAMKVCIWNCAIRFKYFKPGL